MKGICLCSGGLDSTLALLRLLKEGNEVVPMFVGYNQWPLEGEFKATTGIVEWASHAHFDGDKILLLCPGIHLRNLVTVGVDWGEKKVGSVWGRNIALVGLAAMWAYTHGDDYDFIALGNHEGDVGPDCKPGLFDTELGITLGEATKHRMMLLLPIRKLTVEDIGRELAKFSIPWNLMYSCYWHPPCGYKSIRDGYLCPGCRRKALAMVAGGEESPSSLLFPNCQERTYQSPLAEKTVY